jgi:hypothetical protein
VRKLTTKNKQEDNGVRDKYERMGEMFLAFVGVVYGMIGGFYEVLTGRESIIIIVISFILYQSTSIAEIFVNFLEKFINGR